MLSAIGQGMQLGSEINLAVGAATYGVGKARKAREKSNVYKSEAEKALERERNRFKRPTVSETMKKKDRYNI